MIKNISRLQKQLIMMAFDTLIIVFILWASFSIRLGLLFEVQGAVAYLIYLTPIFALPIFIRFGLYKAVIRFISFKGLWAIVQAVSLYALLWGVAAFLFIQDGIPRSVVIINWILSILLIGGSRLIARWLLTEFSNNQGKKVIIYGAGSAGRQLLLALKSSHEYNPIAFVDDDESLIKRYIGGVEVLDKKYLKQAIEKHQIKEILLAIPSITTKHSRQIVNFLQDFPVQVRTLPGVSQIASGKVELSDLQKISIDDLLGRDRVKPNIELLGKNITEKVVFVSGAGGSIGSELCRQILSLKPKKLILYELSEFALYEIDKELSNNNNKIIPLLGSVTNKARLIEIFNTFKVDSVYHAAAYKHVPMVEFNTTQGVNNNIFGTLNCALAAIKCRVKNFIFISTDKAVRPTNTMGATKRFGELILQALSKKQDITNFAMVRFGNVLGSSGSVIPLFTEQIKDGGPITVTDKNITRFFMTIPEAVELVIQAGSMSLGGDMFVLDMGSSIKIDDLARKMVHLSGLEIKDEAHPDGDIEIKYSGLRAGEKLYEELLIGDNIFSTKHPMIMRANEEEISWAELEVVIEKLKIELENNNPEAIRILLTKTISGFKPQCGIEDLVVKI